MCRQHLHNHPGQSPLTNIKAVFPAERQWTQSQHLPIRPGMQPNKILADSGEIKFQNAFLTSVCVPNGRTKQEGHHEVAKLFP